MKVTVIGGGSTYTPELISGFLARFDSFPISELWLMDNNAERLKIVGGFAQRIVENKGAPFDVILTTDQRKATQGTSYVITQLRVGMMEARRSDEYLGHRHGLIGQETTGVGGMAKALRTIPVVLNIAKDMAELAPDALLVNFTNPSGLVTEALVRYAKDVTSVGVCNVPITTQMGFIEKLEELYDQNINPQNTHLDTLGLNHLSWHRGFSLDGEDVWPQLIQGYVKHLQEETEPEWAPRLVESLQMIPNYYLNYFYQTEKKLHAQKDWPPSRADDVIEIEQELLAQYADPNLNEPPEDLMKRGGAYYSTLATQILTSHFNNLGETHVVNTPHRGAVPGWPEDWVLEMPCIVDAEGIHPLPTEPLPPACFGLIAQVKSYELLTVEAAVHGDREAAFQALLANPLGPAADKVQETLDDILEINRPYLPQFWT
jgi:6-phospho-beta-glucosidase